MSSRVRFGEDDDDVGANSDAQEAAAAECAKAWRELREVTPAFEDTWKELWERPELDRMDIRSHVGIYVGFLLEFVVFDFPDAIPDIAAELNEMLASAGVITAPVKTQQGRAVFARIAIMDLVAEAAFRGGPSVIARLTPLLEYPRVREAWLEGLRTHLPHHVWDDRRGVKKKPTHPRPIATIYVDDAFLSDATGRLMFRVTLIGGEIAAGCLIENAFLKKPFFDRGFEIDVVQRLPATSAAGRQQFLLHSPPPPDHVMGMLDLVLPAPFADQYTRLWMA